MLLGIEPATLVSFRYCPLFFGLVCRQIQCHLLDHFLIACIWFNDMMIVIKCKTKINKVATHLMISMFAVYELLQ